MRLRKEAQPMEYPDVQFPVRDRFLTIREGLPVWAEANKLLCVTYAFWFVGVICSLIGMWGGESIRIPVYSTMAVMMTISFLLFKRVMKTYMNDEPRPSFMLLRSLFLMGVSKPTRLIKTYPKHFAAYRELFRELGRGPEAHTLSLIVFTGENRHSCVEYILHAVQKRKVTNVGHVFALVVEQERNPSMLNDGSL